MNWWLILITVFNTIRGDEYAGYDPSGGVSAEKKIKVS